MREILLINPNTSVDTTAMMVAIAQTCAPNGYMVSGATAARGVSMILDAERLQDASEEVIESWKRHRGDLSGIVISAFGDPGIDMLRALTDVPIVGIFEASLFEAAQGDRPFGIATVTPDLPPEAWEPMETMVEAALALCTGDPNLLSGRVACPPAN